jgi:hypothetical protein
MAVRHCLWCALLISALSTGCRRSSQTWSKCTHDKPIIELKLVWQETGPTSYPRGTSTHVLQLEDSVRNACLNIADSYLNDDGDSTFSTSRCKGHVVATYYCEEIEVDHRLVLEFMHTAKGIGVRRAMYFLHTHGPPEPAWDCEYDPPREVRSYERGMALPPNLTLAFNEKALGDVNSLIMEVTIPDEAIPSGIRRSVAPMP